MLIWNLRMGLQGVILQLHEVCREFRRQEREHGAYLILRSHRKRIDRVMIAASTTDPTTAGTTTTGFSSSSVALLLVELAMPAQY